MPEGAEKPRTALPRWFVPVMIAAAVVVVGAAVAILVVVVSGSIAVSDRQAKVDAEAETAAARLRLIPDAVAACGLDSSLVMDGGRRFVGVLGFGGKVSGTDLDCLEEKLGVGSDNGFPSVQAGDPPKSAGAGGFTWTTYYPRWMGDITYTIELDQ